LEQEVSGDRFTLDLYNFLHSATPEKIARDKTARAKYIKAQQDYDSLQTAEAQTEAVSLLTEAAAEFDRLGDNYQALLAQHFKMLLLAFTDDRSTFDLCHKLESEARSGKYLALLLRVKSQQQNLSEYQPVNRQADLQEIKSLTNRVNDLNSYYSLVLKDSYHQSSFERLAEGIRLITSKELENKDRQNIYNNLSETLAGSRHGTKLVAVESSLEGALISSSTNIRLVSAQGWRKIGENYSNLGDFAKAQEYFDKALRDNNQAIDAMRMTAIDYLAMAKMVLKKKNYAESIKYFEKVFENSNRKFDSPLELDARISFAKALIRSGAKEKSAETLSEADALIEEARSEKTKIDNNVLSERKESLKRTIVEYYLDFEPDPQAALIAYATDQQDISRVDHTNERSLDWIKQFQGTIRPDSQKIVYLIGEDQTAAWVISSVRCDYFPIRIGKDVLEGKIEKLRELVSAKPSTENQANALTLSQELYSIIIQPLEQRIEKGSKLLFFSDQSLSLLPYSTLVNPVSGEPLIREHQIQEISSLGVSAGEATFSGQATPDTDMFLGISNPVFDKSQYPGLRSLASADEEVNQIATLFTRQLTLKGKEASPSQVVSGLKRAQIIHLSAHSIIDETNPWQSKLLLSKPENEEGDSLSADSIRRMNLSNIKFASLSSCSSVGLPADDGNITGLARAFIDAGVPVVVASLWDIDSKQSSAFMSRFYHYYAAGNSPARALQLSQLDTINSNRMLSSFSIGSAFVVISRN
jgi:CHAT domain-containing protein